MKRLRQPRGHRPAITPLGFTLVELLVVVGIIALLIAILLPSLGRAREQARAIVCANNEKQVATAVFLYVNDNRRMLPLIVSPYPPYQTPFEAICMTSPAQLDYEQGVLWPYVAPDLRTRQLMFNCPSDPDPKYYNLGLNPAAPTPPRNLSYVITDQINRASMDPVRARILAGGTSDTAGVYALPLSRVRHPEHKMLIIEQLSPGGICGAEDVQVAVEGTNLMSMLSDRHSGKANIAFFDGHCEAIDRSTFAGNSNTTNTPQYYYYVDVYKD